ncbi:hypothetical protein RRG08_047296 [Elysia crispata]|uniref:Uncharacterized protein n=1 Tax=Elysia crispata TaxID=231223 RepID=A0AAE0ZCI4_9GAST|nr:hypothetical protein RRG08_047296 [Elysia crispata]
MSSERNSPVYLALKISQYRDRAIVHSASIHFNIYKHRVQIRCDFADLLCHLVMNVSRVWQPAAMGLEGNRYASIMQSQGSIQEADSS